MMMSFATLAFSSLRRRQPSPWDAPGYRHRYGPDKRRFSDDGACERKDADISMADIGTLPRAAARRARGLPYRRLPPHYLANYTARSATRDA